MEMWIRTPCSACPGMRLPNRSRPPIGGRCSGPTPIAAAGPRNSERSRARSSCSRTRVDGPATTANVWPHRRGSRRRGSRRLGLEDRPGLKGRASPRDQPRITDRHRIMDQPRLTDRPRLRGRHGPGARRGLTGRLGPRAVRPASGPTRVRPGPTRARIPGSVTTGWSPGGNRFGLGPARSAARGQPWSCRCSCWWFFRLGAAWAWPGSPSWPYRYWF